MMKYIIIMALLIGSLLAAGCSERAAVCSIPADCERLSPGDCAGAWQCDQGKCNYACAKGLTGNNDTDEIGNQLDQINHTQDYLDLGYIDE